MAKTSVGRDPFARGEYERRTHGPGICRFCGRATKVLYTFVWRPDDSTRNLDTAHRRAAMFCKIDCHKSFHS